MSIEAPCVCSSPEDCAPAPSAPTTTPRGISVGTLIKFLNIIG